MDRQAHEDLVLDALRFLIAGGGKKRSNDILIFLLKFEYGIDAIYKVWFLKLYEKVKSHSNLQKGRVIFQKKKKLIMNIVCGEG